MMSDWLGRLRPSISLTSPDGAQFTAVWRGNDITGAIRVGQFNVPLVDGTIAQPMGANGLNFPLTLYFEGADNDTAAMAFLRALCASRGAWTVVHPQFGTLNLQPLGNPTLSADPTDSGNITKVETTWLEVTSQIASKSTAQLGGDVNAQVDTANAAIGGQFEDAVNTTDPEAQAAAGAAGTRNLGAFLSSKLAFVQESAADIQAAFTAAYNSAFGAITETVWDATQIYTQVQAILDLPAVVQADLTMKLAAFTDFVDRVIEYIDPDAGKSPAVMNELFLSSAMAAAVLATTVNPPTNRDQVIVAINSLNDMFTAITDALDSVQSATETDSITEQYFSNGLSYHELARLVSLGIAFLSRLIFDLKIAKRFTLDRPRHPGEIVVTEYSPADSSTYDALYDLFIASNNLIGNDIILLPAGREVVVYV
jgi:hypothetical protein